MNIRNKSIFFQIILLISLLSVSDTFAEQSTIDSLLIVLKTAKDTNRVRVLNALSWEDPLILIKPFNTENKD